MEYDDVLKHFDNITICRVINTGVSLTRKKVFLNNTNLSLIPFLWDIVLLLLLFSPSLPKLFYFLLSQLHNHFLLSFTFTFPVVLDGGRIIVGAWRERGWVCQQSWNLLHQPTSTVQDSGGGWWDCPDCSRTKGFEDSRPGKPHDRLQNIQGNVKFCCT